MSEKLCLQWNDFKENVTTTFGSLRQHNNDFADVTLACEDGKQFEVHKVILATSSPFFQNLLKKNNHAHPLIYMRGLKSEDLEAIIDFLYCGETDVYQENLDSFLAIAEELQLKGLMGKTNEDEVEQQETAKQRQFPVPKNESHISKEAAELSQANQIVVTDHGISFGTMATTSNFSDELKKLDNQTTSMMVKASRKSTTGNPFYKCTLCGKEAEKTNLKNHIEANHLEGILIPCIQCEKTFRSRDSLGIHKHRHHNRNPSTHFNVLL